MAHNLHEIREAGVAAKGEGRAEQGSDAEVWGG